MNKAAQQLGRRARGKPKVYSASELAIRTERLTLAREAKRKKRNERNTTAAPTDGESPGTS